MIVEYAAAAIVVALYSFACLALGAALIRLLAGRRDVLSRWEPLAATGSAFLLGQGVLAALWTLIATAGQFAPEVVVAGTAGALLVGARPGARLLRRLGQRLRAALSALGGDSPGWRLAGLLTLALIGMTGLAALLPAQPLGDALAFYLPMPRLISDTHHMLAPHGYEYFSKIGLQGELHFAALMSLSGATAAKLFVWPVSLAAGLMLLGLGHEAGLGRRAKWTALVALVTSTAFTNVIWDGKVDTFGAAMGLAAFYWALQTAGDERKLAVSLTGLFTALAVIAKISYLPALLPGVGLLVIWQWAARLRAEARPIRPALRQLAGQVVWLGIWAGVAWLPHVVKSAVLFGEPLAPFIGADSTMTTNQVWFSPDTTWRILLTYPLALVYGRFWAQAGTLSPLLLAFAPLMLGLPRPRPALRSKLLAIVLAGLLGVVVWTVLRPSVFAPRYFMAPLLVLLLPVARAAERFSWPVGPQARWVAKLIAPVLLVALLIESQPFFLRSRQVYGLATGRLTPCELEVATTDASCRVAELVNGLAAPGERVFMASYYTYWLRSDLLQCMSASIANGSDLPTPVARWEYLIEQGNTLLIIDRLRQASVFDQLRPDHPPAWLEIELLYDGEQDIDSNPFLAYRFSSRDDTHQAQMTCIQVSPPRWQPVAIDRETSSAAP